MVRILPYMASLSSLIGLCLLPNLSQLVTASPIHTDVPETSLTPQIKPQRPSTPELGSNLLGTEPIVAEPMIWMAQHNHSAGENPEDWPSPVHDDQLYWSVLVDQLEYRVNGSQDLFYWDLQGWIGGDYQRFWVKSEGDVDLDSGNGEAEIQVLYSQLFSPYWEWQAGIRYDQLYGDTDRGRAFAVLGIEGLAPYFFEVEAALFISQAGDISARVKTEYELLLTQQLILQPKLEVNAAIQRVDEFGVGSGINDLDLGLRLRYEVTRQFAPYIGINWTKKLGETADFATEEGESTNEVSAVMGVRLFF